jgi:hypothetical protein
MIARKVLPLTAVLLLPWLTISDAEAAQRRDLVYSRTVELDAGEYLKLGFDKFRGKEYRICVEPDRGNADLYTHFTSWATRSSYQFKSTKSGSKRDCVEFDATKDGKYYFSIYAKTDTKFTFRVRES